MTTPPAFVVEIDGKFYAIRPVMETIIGAMIHGVVIAGPRDCMVEIAEDLADQAAVERLTDPTD